MHIAIAGNIGSGKTTLTELLAKHYKGNRTLKTSRTILISTISTPPCSAGHSTCKSISCRADSGKCRRHPQERVRCHTGPNHLRRRTHLRTESSCYGTDELKKGLQELSIPFQPDGTLPSATRSDDLSAGQRSNLGGADPKGRSYEAGIRLDYLNRLNERYEAWITTYSKGKILHRRGRQQVWRQPA